MIETVFLDLDNTIFDFSRAERLALSRTLKEMGLDPCDATLKRYSEINISQWKRLERGEINRTEVKKGRFRLLFEELGVNADEAEAARIYEGFLSQGHFFIEGAEDLLSSLYGRYTLYMVTNGTASVQKGRLSGSGIEHYFENIFISEMIGHEKPSREFFEYCFGTIPGFSKETAVIIGDSLTSDILGGINAGIRTIHFNPSGGQRDPSIVPDKEVLRLLEIPDILKSM